MRKSFLLVSCLLLLCLSDLSAQHNTTYIYPPWKHTWGVRRATPLKLRVFVGKKTSFKDPQGFACVLLKAWDNPDKKSDDDELTIYGVNSGDNCIIYNTSMFGLGVYGLENEHEKFNRPWGIAADTDGNVYVADRGNSRIVHLYNPGKELQFLRVIGGPGDSAGQFVDPRGVALDSEGCLYVTDAALGRVSVFDTSGTVKDTWDYFVEPDGIAVIGPADQWSFYKNDAFVIVLDSLHQRIRKLSLEGDVLAEVLAANMPTRNSYFSYAAIDYHSQVLVTDRNNGCIHKFDRDLNLVTCFGKSGRGNYEFVEPRGIAIHRRLGQLFIAEREGAQYLWVAVDVSDLKASVRTDSVWKDLDIDFSVTEPALCDFDVLDEYGRFIARISLRRRFNTGTNHVAWNMIIPRVNPFDGDFPELPPEYIRGEYLPPGKYRLRGRFRAVYSSREHFEKEVETEFVVKGE